jgi:hypothetical protein
MELPSNRTIHLVDIENVCRNPRPRRVEVEAARRCYEDLISPKTGDHIVLACNHGACVEVGLGWRGARVVTRSGPNGADRALLDVIDQERLSSRFQHVVIGSGDGIFADAAAQLASDGLDVTVVSLKRALSRRLQLAACRVCYIPEPDHFKDAA